jgi:hypothetical protein
VNPNLSTVFLFRFRVNQFQFIRQKICIGFKPRTTGPSDKGGFPFTPGCSVDIADRSFVTFHCFISRTGFARNVDVCSNLY